MHRRHRATRSGAAAPIIALALMFTFVVGGVAALGTHRPHMGAPAADNGTIYWNPIRNGWTVNEWGGCRTLVRWYIEPNVPAGWASAISAGISKWDSSSYCGPDFIKTTTASAARLKFRVEDDVYCGMNGVAVWFAIACRHYANSPTDQAWTIAFNDTDANFGVGSSGKFDVESIVVNEMGHVLYLDHNTGWADGVVQTNSCTWGTTSCTVKNEMGFSDFSPYVVSCSNCGSRRSVLSGDWNVVKHIYGLNPCQTICPESAGPYSQIDPGPLSSAAIAAELEAQNPNTTRVFMHDVHLLEP